MQDCKHITSSAPQEPDPWCLAGDVFDVLVRLVQGISGALFSLPAEGSSELRLITSRHVDQRALDTARHEWARATDAVRRGAPVYRPCGDGRLMLLLPCLQAAEVSGLACIELGPLSDHLPAADLITFAAILGRLLARLEPFVLASVDPLARLGARGDAGDSEAADRANLVLFLERQDWNISRVARLMGVTRMTVYNRLRRLGIPRQRVRRSDERRQEP